MKMRLSCFRKRFVIPAPPPLDSFGYTPKLETYTASGETPRRRCAHIDGHVVRGSNAEGVDRGERVGALEHLSQNG